MKMFLKSNDKRFTIQTKNTYDNFRSLKDSAVTSDATISVGS